MYTLTLSGALSSEGQNASSFGSSIFVAPTLWGGAYTPIGGSGWALEANEPGHLSWQPPQTSEILLKSVSERHVLT